MAAAQNKDRDPVVAQRLAEVDQYAAGAKSGVDDITRELSAVIAQHGQRGRQAYETALGRVAADQSAAQSRTVAAQGARTHGGLDAASAAAVASEVGSGYSRARQDLEQVGKLRNQNLADYGDLVQGYLGQVAATIPLAQEQHRLRIEAQEAQAQREAEARAADAEAKRQADWEDWVRRQEYTRAHQEAEQPSYSDMRVQATAQGRIDREQERQRLLQARERAAGEKPRYTGGSLDAYARNAQSYGPAAVAAIDRQLAELDSRPEEDWATAAAMRMFGGIGQGLFDEPELDAGNFRAQARADWEGLAGTTRASGLTPDAPEQVLPNRTGQYLAMRELGVSSPQDAVDNLAVEYAVRSGMSRPAAEKLILGAAIDADDQRTSAVKATPEYAEAQEAAESLRMFGGTKAELQVLLGKWGIPQQVAAVILDEYGPLMASSDYAAGRDTEGIDELLGD